jgi:DNA-binding LytR/AlgR family response regulator
MIASIIIEDDPISADHLVATLKELKADLEIKAILSNVKDAVEYLRSSNGINLIFSDIQLKDGLSFSIFEQVPVSCPIVFISAYDKYMVNVFDYCGIDYLLKPISQDDVSQALSKYSSLEKHFSSKDFYNPAFEDFLRNKKTRIIVRRGSMLISLPINDVVFFYTENLVVYVYDNKGNKYLIDKSLNVLENELDTRMFMRVNRQYILNINYVYGYKSYDRVKLLISLTVKDIDNTIIVGQEKAKHFRQWLSEF